MSKETEEILNKMKKKYKLALFMVIRNSMVMPKEIELGKTEKEINEMTYETMRSLLTMIDYNKSEEFYKEGKGEKNSIEEDIKILKEITKGNEELKEIEAEYKKTNSELFKNNVELRIENERLKHERIKYIGRNLNNNIKQKQKEDEQLNALNEGWKIELENKNKEIKELKEKYDKDTHTLQNQLDITNADKINNYICKSEIKCKIEELDIEISECEYSDDDDEKYKKAVEKDKLCLLNQKKALKQLLESEE